MDTPGEHPLSMAFMRGHPAQAARVLESLPAAEAAPLFAHAPARLGARVLAAMLPHRAALCLGALPDARALELLAPMGTQPIVALLRQLPEPRRQRLIAGLPTAAALASTLLLGYAEDTLGAWADPEVLALPATARAADALARVRTTPPAHPLVFVSDAAGGLAGTVGLAALLQAPDAATLATLQQPVAHTLAANAPLAGTTAHPGWEQSSLLPVLEGGRRMVGVLTRDALARALRQRAPAAAPAAGGGGFAGMLAGSYWQALAGLLDGALSLLPRVPPAWPVTPAAGATASPPAAGATDVR